MNTSLVLTILGDDRPGLVGSVSAILEQHQGNWLESRMVDLAGKFAGVLKVAVPETRVGELTEALSGLQSQGIEIQVRALKAVVENPDKGEIIELEVMGPDAPGIVNNITRQLAALKVNIEELSSEQQQAPMSGEMLFCAQLTLELPAGVDKDKVQDSLEDLADQLMVNLAIS